MKGLFGTFLDGQGKHVRNLQTAAEYMTDLKGNTNIHEWTNKTAAPKQYKLGGGGTIDLTPSQVMSLYLLNGFGNILTR